ncbi:hypothetical protein M8C21_020031 [Ambrosia artemisiifolia]|uniref:Uncharacterized protein n=1 Tax=Ambrosia artemisiifolia TaxID=4212 RepID=A0AAD5D5T6_AMBAR|nr:hypothetical protein M8C21_020031 [Ambrosia artemisiifolia]
MKMMTERLRRKKKMCWVITSHGITSLVEISLLFN